MVSGRPHYRLQAWREAMELVKEVYRVTQAFPKEEMFGLSAQVRRAAVSVPSNIAEGAARRGAREFAQFLNIAMGSISELDTQLMIAASLGYLTEDDPVFGGLERVSRLLAGLKRSVSN